MAFPRPAPGQVISYAYLWHVEYRVGLDEGLKDRPCAVVLVVTTREGAEEVVVLPITHSPPRDAVAMIEIPGDTKRRLGLDDARSWIVLTEANRFLWPGPDLRPRRRGDASSVVYGLLPRRFYLELRSQFLVVARARKARLVSRTD